MTPSFVRTSPPTAGTGLLGRTAFGATLAGSLLYSLHYAYVQIFSRLPVYDDEGYIMMSLERHFAGGALYDKVFSQYGPFFYLLKRLIYTSAGLTVTHDSTRWMNLIFWTASALLCGFTVYRLTGSRLAGLLSYLTLILFFTPFSNEPGHPQETIVFLCCAGLAVTAAHRFAVRASQGMFVLTA